MSTPPVIWWADGRMDFIIVFKSDAKTLPRWEKCGFGKGVYWFRADSKWTTKETYVQMLRYFFTTETPCEILLDDMHGGHCGVQDVVLLCCNSFQMNKVKCDTSCAHSAAPDEFMKSVGGQRIRVPGVVANLSKTYLWTLHIWAGKII